MRHELEIDGKRRTVLVDSAGDGFAVTVDNRTWQVDAALVDGHVWSLMIRDVSPKGDLGVDLLRPGATHEVTVWPGSARGQLTVGIGTAAVSVTLDGRRRRGPDGGGVDGSAGPQRLVAPMPGKIVRLLVKPGDVVRARQPVVVVEAMKMENELRAAGNGTVAEVRVREGASVEAGALLVVIA